MNGRTFSTPDVAVRAIKAAGHASVFYLLALPFVVFSTCGGPTDLYTGYQALGGIPFSPAEWNLDPTNFAGFGRDWWVAGIMVVALLGVACAVIGDVKGAAAGLGATIVGFICFSLAISFFNPPQMGDQWNPEPASGGNDILLVYVALVLADLAWLTGKSWSVLRRHRGTDFKYRGEWAALRVFSTAFLAIVGVVVLAGAAITVAIERQ